LFGKRLHLWKLKVVLIIAILLVSNLNAVGQKQSSHPNAIGTDTALVKKQERDFFSFLKRIFHKNYKKPVDDYVSNEHKHDTVSKKKSGPPLLDIAKGSITWTSLYSQGINLNTGITGLYSVGRLSQGMDIYGLPITVLGNGVFNNGQFQRSYSSVSVNFDVETYLKRLRKRASDVLLNKNIKSNQPNLSDSLNAYETQRKKLQSSSYQSEESGCKTQFQRDEDSLKKHPGADTTELHNLRVKLHTFEQAEKHYQQLFAIKKSYSSLQKLDTAGNGYRKEEKILDNPGNVEKVLEENHQLSSYEKFLMGVRQFTIGQCPEEISEFTFHNFVMNGVSMGYKTDNIYTYVGYGKEVAAVNPLLLSGVTVPTYHRDVEFFRTGEGAENSSNFYVTLIKISDPGSSSALNETNWVFDAIKKIVIGKNIDVEGELAKSTYTYNYVPGKPDSAVLPFISQNNNTLAFALRAKGTIAGLNTVIKAEGSKTGGDFVTLGNPYLISNATKYELDLSQPFGKRLIVEVGGAHLIASMVNSNGTKQTDDWIQFSILFKPTHLISMEFKYVPRQSQQESSTVYANSSTSNINQISYTANILSRIFGKNSITSFFAGNFQYTAGDVSQLLTQQLNLTYYVANELFMVSPTQGINMSVDESRNNWTGGLTQFIGQSTYNCNVSKSFTVSFGPQWVEQPGTIPNGIGVISTISSSIQKWGKIGLQITYRNNAMRPLDSSSQYMIGGNVSVMW